MRKDLLQFEIYILKDINNNKPWQFPSQHISGFGHSSVSPQRHIPAEHVSDLPEHFLLDPQ